VTPRMRPRLLAGLSAVLVALLSFAGIAVPGAGAAPGPANAPEYWFDAWHVGQLWDSGARGQGVTIAEIDTGVNASLPELAANVVAGKDFGAAGGDGRIDREVNEFGHGTAMASIMVAHRGILDITGLAPDARLLPIAVPLTGTTDKDGNDHLADAIRWAADHGAKVISMSLGGARKPGVDSVPCPADEQNAVFYAMRKGSVVLASSGNTGLKGNLVEEPGVCLGVVSVGAVDQNNQVADFSSRHPYLTLTAPGVNIPTLGRVPGTAYSGDGTSQATAVASAAFALVWSKFPALSGRDLLTRILASTDDHRSTRDPGYGFGVVNAYRAITTTVRATAPNPVYDAAAPFLARSAALASADAATAPKPAPVDGSLGSFSVGHSPRLFAPRVVLSGSVALAGLILLIALAVLGVVRRRHPPSPTPGPDATGAATSTDATGTVWLDIVESAPKESEWFR
jgi:subtilisin family serine protease